MSGLIRQAQSGVGIAAIARTLTLAARPPERDPALLALEAEVAALQAGREADRRKYAEEIKALRRDCARDVGEAKAAGRNEAVAADHMRLKLLEAGITQAAVAWRERLASLDGLAAVLAMTVLTKMFGEHSVSAEWVAKTLAHHVDLLDRRSVVSVAVSSADFTDDTALVTLTTEAGIAPDCLIVRPELPSGACRVTLKLGEVELDPATQWGVLKDALAALEEAA